jgi:hypothetical protein
MSSVILATYQKVLELDIQGDMVDAYYQCRVLDGYDDVVIAVHPVFEGLQQHCNASTIFERMFNGDSGARNLYFSAEKNGGLLLCDVWVPFVAYTIGGKVAEDRLNREPLASEKITAVIQEEIDSLLYRRQQIPDGVTFITGTTTVPTGVQNESKS